MRCTYAGNRRIHFLQFILQFAEFDFHAFHTVLSLFFLFHNVTAQGKEGERSAGRDTTGQ